jgi:hypothetical protein
MQQWLVELVNLTSCDVVLKAEDDGLVEYIEYPGQEQGSHAYVEVEQGKLVATLCGILIRGKPRYVVHNLPDPGETRGGVPYLYIVDRRVADACPERTDLVCLGQRHPDYYAQSVGRYLDLYIP